MPITDFRPPLTTVQGNIADTESVTVLASGWSGRQAILHRVRLATTSGGPALALVVGSTTVARTTAAALVVQMSNYVVAPGTPVTVTATGGTGDGDVFVTVERR